MLHKEKPLCVERTVPSGEAFRLKVAFVLWCHISDVAAPGSAASLVGPSLGVVSVHLSVKGRLSPVCIC